jgi:hypothetical protein
MGEAMVRNRRTRSEYLLFNEAKKMQGIGKMTNLLDEIHRLKGGDGNSQQFQVKHLNSLPGKRKHGPKLNLESVNTIEDGIPKKVKLVPNEEDRGSHIRTLHFAWYKTLDRFPIEAREGATWTRVGNRAYLIGGINKNLVDKI